MKVMQHMKDQPQIIGPFQQTNVGKSKSEACRPLL
jgi:hypothetical protein